MSSKRTRKNTAEISSTNNNYKKSKNAVVTEALDMSARVKNKKKENKIISINDEKVAIGKKRKLPDSDLIPIAKKSKKRGKISVNTNNLEADDVSSSESSSNMTNKKEPKKSKKKNKVTLNNEECFIDILNNDMDTSEILVQKVSKKKKKSIKDKYLEDPGSTLVKKESSLTSELEMNSKQFTENIGEESIKELIEVKGEHCTENGSIHLSVKDLQDDHSNINETEFPEMNMKKVENSEIPKTKTFMNWPEEDLRTLIDRIEACIPENDTLAFGTRVEKLEWDTIPFKEYSIEECKKMWLLLQKQIRRFRLLREVLADAKEWIRAPKSNKKKSFRHPDMPRKPLTAYFIYYLQKKDAVTKTHPGLDAAEISKTLGQKFKSLPPEKRLKYENLAAKKKKEYEKKLEEFYQLHPDVPRIVKADRIKPGRKQKLPKPLKEKPQKPQKERIPKRPPPPFHYYYLSELEKQDHVDDRLAFKELCKERWKQLPDEKKVVWINSAETEYAKYEEALRKYNENHPDCIQSRHKPILTKEEVQIKDRMAGKPSKPPGSAYNLFARVMLQSEEIKSIPIRDRLNFVSNQWKNAPEEEKKQYKDLSAKLNEKYKTDYASYLESLPEEERKLELQKQIPKRRKLESLETEKKEKLPKKKAEKKATVSKLVEPEQPPISAFKYFASQYNGKEPVLQAWKALSSEQKKTYEDELVKKKQAYIVDFEKFLKSLTKEELEAFSNSRKKNKKALEQDDEEEGTGTSDESGTDDSGAESNEEDYVN